MKRTILLVAGLLLTLTAFAAKTAEESKKDVQSLQWHVGPAAEQIGTQATIKTDATHEFLDDKNTQKFLELSGNIPLPDHFLLTSPIAGWWAIFHFNPSGYVKDDEKIDGDALLKRLKDLDVPVNEERKRLGLTPIYTEGWYIPPHYDIETKRLEWGLKLKSEGGIFLNYTIRMLGRTGVMSATLVSAPETLDADVKSFKKALENYKFNSGEQYSEFKAGDHVAEFGLAALIAGGAAAVATKKGFWAVFAGFFAAFWKLLLAGFAAVVAWVASKFNRKS